MTESLKELNLNDKSGGLPPSPCGAPNLKGTSFKNLFSEMISADWREALGDLMGNDKLCSMDTTEPQPSSPAVAAAAASNHHDGKKINSTKSTDEESYHDFYLI